MGLGWVWVFKGVDAVGYIVVEVEVTLTTCDIGDLSCPIGAKGWAAVGDCLSLRGLAGAARTGVGSWEQLGERVLPHVSPMAGGVDRKEAPLV